MDQAKEYSRATELWQEVLVLDPDNKLAQDAIAELRKKQVAAEKAATRQKPPEPPKPKISQAEVETMYKKGVSFFANDRYQEALALFKQVLDLDPNHVGAKDYKARTEARIRILEGG